MRTAICAIVKNEAPYLADWIAYHKTIGFDKFFICNNESEDKTGDILEEAKSLGICECYYWPYKDGVRTQDAAYKHLLNEHRADVDWMLFLDVDEYLLLKKHPDVKALLNDYDGISAIGMNWRIFGDSGQSSYDTAPLFERFLQASPRNFGPNHLIKTIARTADIVTAGVHTHELVENAKFINPIGTNLKHYPSARQDSVSHDIVQINHYYSKTLEEYVWKKNRGSATLWKGHKDFISRNDDHFNFHNRNDFVDDEILTKITEEFRLLRSNFRDC
jgi:hypothetical protein